MGALDSLSREYSREYSERLWKRLVVTQADGNGGSTWTKEALVAVALAVAAALGENLILVVNLGWSAVLYTRFLHGQVVFNSLERWQTTYVPVYAVWAWVVVVIFPLVFSFR